MFIEVSSVIYHPFSSFPDCLSVFFVIFMSMSSAYCYFLIYLSILSKGYTSPAFINLTITISKQSCVIKGDSSDFHKFNKLEKSFITLFQLAK